MNWTVRDVGVAGRGFASWAVGLLVMLCLPLAAWADVLYLKSGDRLTGKVDSIAGQRVVLDTDFAGRLAVKLDTIKSIETDEAFNLKLEDGEQLSGKLVTRDDAQGVAVDESAPEPLVLADLRSAGQSNLALTNLGSEWSSRADLSAAVSRGNSDTDAYNALIESGLKRNRSEHLVTLLLSQEEAAGDSTKDQLKFGYGYKRFFAEQWYFSGNGEYFQDQLKDIDYRITAGAGIGYQLWDNSFGALSVEAGASSVIEKLAGEKEENPAFRWAAKYNRFLWSKRLELFHDHSILIIPDRGEVFAASTGLRLAINDRLDTSVRVDLQHETDPPLDSEKTDVTYSVGVGIKF